jgi:hypothetical protein
LGSLDAPTSKPPSIIQNIFDEVAPFVKIIILVLAANENALYFDNK